MQVLVAKTAINLFLHIISGLIIFFSSLTTHAKVLGLADVVSQALRHNPNALSARADERAAEHRIAIAQAGYLPTVTLTAGRGHEWTDTLATEGIVKLHRQENSLSLSQLVFDGFGVVNQIRSERALHRFAGFNRASTEEEIALQAIEAMLNIVQSEKFIALGLENLSTHKESLAKVKVRFRAGASHQGDYQLVVGRLALAKSTFSRLKNEFADAKALYTQVLGAAPETFQVVQTPAKIMPETLEQAIKIALEKSPLIWAAQASIESMTHQVRQAKATFSPRLSLELRANNNVNLDGVRGDNQDRTAMLQLSYNIFNGGADLAAVKEAQERLVGTELTLESTRRAVIEQITRDWNLWEVTRSRLSSQQSHVQASAMVLKAYQNEFKVGKRQILNVLDQKNELFQSKIEYQRGLTDVKRSAFRLLASMGLLVQYSQQSAVVVDKITG